MTRPQIIRADTIDLQDPDSPSAKDHTRQPSNPNPIGEGPPAPHQAATLKSSGLDGLELHSRSPRASQDLSTKELQLLHEHADGDEAESIEGEGAASQRNGTSEDGEGDEEGEEGLDDDMMDKISSSPSIDDEDIDFEFVYALHTFVATVEGQANATKGDTMVLLDDSNSYWWLVRVVKDSSIGYLPAEHIETPTERLARLNKHRNIDLSQTMLGDNPEKFKNPLKKAMRRRNGKTVAFAEQPNTYFPADETEYLSEEENEEEPEFITSALDGPPEQAIENGVDTVEPLRIREVPKENGQLDGPRPEVTPISQATESVKSQEDKIRSSAESVESQDELVGRSNRKMRNTDSFFKDEEPRKINLTPSLLRDDSNTASTITVDSRNRGSMESNSKPASSEKPKEDKRKEKKGMLGGLFKRKERKSKTQTEDDDPELLNKEIAANRQSPQPKMSSESAPSEAASTPNSPQRPQPVRQTSKLQKNPPSKSNSFNRGSQRSTTSEPANSVPQVEAPQQISPITNPFENISGEVIADRTFVEQKPALQITPSIAPVSDEPKSPTDSRSRTVFSPIRDVLRPGQNVSTAEPKPEKLKKATTRMTLEDSDESQDDVPFKGRQMPETQRETKDPSPTKDHLSESPVNVTPVLNASQPPMLVGDSSSSQDETARSLNSPTSSPELIERPTEENASGAEDTTATPTSTVQSSRRSNKPRFDWARCQRWFDEEFPTWYTLIMDVSEQMKDFDWRKHWAYKAYGCDEYEHTVEKVRKICDDGLVDFWDNEHAMQEGRPLQHPTYRLFADEEWYEMFIKIKEQEGKKRGEYWLPWEDPEYAYLYPHREDRVKGPHVAKGPPPGYIPRRKFGEPDPKYIPWLYEKMEKDPDCLANVKYEPDPKIVALVDEKIRNDPNYVARMEKQLEEGRLMFEKRCRDYEESRRKSS